MKVSSIVPAYNAERTLKSCLEALLGALPPGWFLISAASHQLPTPNQLEIIVVDDGSTDRTAEIAEAMGVRVVSQPHRGAAAARNLGVREALGEIILFTDADCTVAPDWIERLTSPLLGGASPTTSQQPPIVGSVGRCTSGQGHWVAVLIQTELDERYLKMTHHDRIDFLNTGNCCFRRDLLLTHPFDETFRWLEDVELSFRLAHEGYDMVFVEDARVEHPHPESFMAYLLRKFRYASCAPEIYHRFPEKTFSDSRTPMNRRLQLVLVGFAGLAFGIWALGKVTSVLSAAAWPSPVASWAIFGAVVFLLGSLVSTAPVTLRAIGRSAWLAILAPFFVTAGNFAFVIGTLSGLLSRQGRNRVE